MQDNSPFNIEQYLSRLTLQPIIHGPTAPPMPPPNKRSTVTRLTLGPRGYRGLRQMYHFNSMNDKAIQYFSKLKSVDEDTLGALSLTIEHVIGDPANDFSPLLINDATNIVNLLHYSLLRSAQTILETFDKSMCQWSFETVHVPRNDPTESQSLAILFSRRMNTAELPPVRFIILPVCPWEFTPQDFSEFSSIGRFDDAPANEWRSRRWANADRMWACLYDVCLDRDCRFFAVTSYEQWIFGGFSEYLMNAWFTSLLRFDSKSVSVLEMLTYCIHASFKMDGTFTPHIVPCEKNLTPAYLEKQRQQQRHSKRLLGDGFSGPSANPEDKDGPSPAKRLRKYMSYDGVSMRAAAQARAPLPDRYKKPLRQWNELYELAKMHVDASSSTCRNTQSSSNTVSVAPSIAPSSAEPLPREMIPQNKNAWCERWRNMVATGEEDSGHSWLGTSSANTVLVLEEDSVTGSVACRLAEADGRECPSSCPSSPTLSDCSLTPEELAMWNSPPKDHEDLPGCLYQFF